MRVRIAARRRSLSSGHGLASKALALCSLYAVLACGSRSDLIFGGVAGTEVRDDAIGSVDGVGGAASAEAPPDNAPVGAGGSTGLGSSGGQSFGGGSGAGGSSVASAGMGGLVAAGGSTSERPPQPAPPEVTQDPRFVGPDFRSGAEPTVDLGFPARCEGEPPSLDRTLEALLAAVRAAPPDSRPFLRFVSVGHLTHGSCGSDSPPSGQLLVDMAREGVGELLNYFSRSDQVVLPRSLDVGQLLLQIDLRDYEWHGPVEVGGEGYADVWEMMVDYSRMATVFEGPVAFDLRSRTGTATPLLLSGDLAYAAYPNADLYYAAIASPDTLEELRVRQGVQPAHDLSTGTWLAAGTSRSNVATSPRRVARYLEGGNAPPYWESADFEVNSQVPGPFIAPLEDAADGRVAIYALPNGLPAFFAADAAGQRRGVAELLLDTFQNDFRARAPVSCANCHFEGIIGVEDEVRPVYLAAQPGELEAIEEVLAVYPEQSEIDRAVREDQRYYAAARVRLGNRRPGAQGPELATVHDRDLDAEVMASELFVNVATLRQRLEVLPAEVAIVVLGGGTIQRRSFEAVYADALCALNQGSENRPDGCR